MPISDDELQELWQKHYPRVKGRIIEKIQNVSVAEDLAGEVFLGLVDLVKRGSLRDDTKIEKIIFTITSRKICDWIRTKYDDYMLNPIISYYSYGAIPMTENVVHEYEKKEFSDQIMTSVSNLTDRQKQVFKMTVVEGMSSSDAAEKLQLSEGRIRHLVNRAKEIISDNLARTYFSDPDDGQPELCLWADKFYMAYMRLALKSGELTSENREGARAAWVKIKQKLEV